MLLSIKKILSEMTAEEHWQQTLKNKICLMLIYNQKIVGK